MSVALLARRSLSLLSVVLLTACAYAPSRPAAFELELGLAGKDVSWHPTPHEMVAKMLDLAAVGSSDYVIDLGSGDGRIAIAAAQRGARAVGIEYNPDLVKLSGRNAIREGVGDRVTFVKADIFESDLSAASVVTAFLLQDLNIKLRPKFLALKPGTRIVSYVFKMGEWAPDETVALGCGAFCNAYLWIVPARVEGSWRLPDGELALAQKYQNVYGTLRRGNEAMKISEGRLRGPQISFTVGGVRYTGRVGAETMEGTIQSGEATRHWGAVRKEAL